MWSLSAADDARNQQRSHIQVLLELALRQYLILLHTSLALQAQQVPKYAHSRRVRLEAATTVLCQLQDVLQSGTSNLTLCFLPTDTV